MRIDTVCPFKGNASHRLISRIFEIRVQEQLFRRILYFRNLTNKRSLSTPFKLHENSQLHLSILQQMCYPAFVSGLGSVISDLPTFHLVLTWSPRRHTYLNSVCPQQASEALQAEYPVTECLGTSIWEKCFRFFFFLF